MEKHGLINCRSSLKYALYFCTKIKVMERKIAVINFKESEGILLAKALSCASGYQLALNLNVCEWIRRFRIDEKQIDAWENQFLLVASSFFKRIETEWFIAEFISNGAAFTEALYLKWKINERRLELNPEESALLKSMLQVTGRHAAAHYCPVVHVKNAVAASFDDLSIHFYKKFQIAYRLYDGETPMIELLEKIIRDLEIPVVELPDKAMYEAERLVNFKNWRS